MRSLLLIALVSMTAGAGGRFDRFCYQRGDRGFLCDEPAFFEAFNGAGTTTACSTTAPTGVGSGCPGGVCVLTFTRASTAMCTKTATGGLATTGIANGDLVSLTNDKARVEYDSAGTLGLLVEASSTNFVLRSDEIDNAAWTKESSGAVNTITPNAATAPDNTATADRFQAIATSGAGFADIYQTWTTGAIADPTTCSAYVRGNATNDSTDICAYDGGSWSCTACSYVSASWSRCVHTDAVGAGSTTRFCKLGNNSTQNGGVARNALDAFTWCLQGEAKAYATSCMNTVAATVTRAVEVDSFALPNGLAFGSMALTFVVPWTTASGARELAMPFVSATDFWEPFIAGGGNTTNAFTFVASVSDTVNVADAITPLANTRFAQYRTPSPTLCGVKGSTTTCDGTGVGATITTAGGTGLVRLGRDTANSFELDGIISRFCLDPDPSRCR